MSKHSIPAPITGNIWKILVQVGQQVKEGDTVVIMESMKMEIPVEADRDGEVIEIVTKEALAVTEGDHLVFLK